MGWKNRVKEGHGYLELRSVLSWTRYIMQPDPDLVHFEELCLPGMYAWRIHCSFWQLDGASSVRRPCVLFLLFLLCAI